MMTVSSSERDAMTNTKTLRHALVRLNKAIRALAQTEGKITLFEASPTKSQRAYEAWRELNDAQAEAAEAIIESAILSEPDDGLSAGPEIGDLSVAPIVGTSK